MPRRERSPGSQTPTPTISRSAIPLEANIIELYIDATSVNEQFDEAVFCFTDDTASAIRNGGVPTSSTGAAAVLSAFRKRMRSRRETPVSGTEATLNGAFMDNIDADLLAGLLNRDRPEFFSAYMKGNRFKDLRFHIRPFGGVPQLLSPEEVALINYSPRGMKEGIWYLAHRKLEYENGSANSLEDPRVVDVKHYKIDANIASNRHLSATAEISFEALHNGTRVVKFGLVPSLRVSDVTFEDAPAHFVQTGEEKDSGFYVILPLVLTKGREYRLVVNDSGDKVIRTAGGGNLSVGARSSWYPSIGSFVDRATYELNFSYPKRFVLVSVGNRVDEGVSGRTAHSSWRSDVELKVAGFNLGDFKRMAIEDETTGMVYEGYATKRPPASLSQLVMSPTPMMKAAVFKSQVATRLFSGWFGPLPYGRLSVTQQPSFGSGQSWPTLIYLPVSAFLDSTQRHSLIGNSEFMFSRFVQEVTPHEVAHQWWGHLVGWATYHDQWISEGFSDFSAGLVLQATGPRDKYIQFLRRSQEVILEKNPFGFRTNDVGPLWMGHRLITAKTASAYRKLIYPKGGFVLHMLRQLMFDAQNASDEPFIRMMMHDFVNTHHNKDASTESFKASVEKHMKPWMDLAGTGKMDWFFGQWVYGTELPSYEFEYSLNAMEGGQAHLKGRISQEGVSDGFRMAVPVYVRLKDRLIRIGAGNMIGTDSPLDINMQLPWMPESVEINSLYDVLAEKVTIKRQ